MKNKHSSGIRVIVRGWGDEPVGLYLYSIDYKRDIAFVGSESSKRPIGLPNNQVFAFTEEAFRQLNEAFQSGNSSQLLGIYAALEKDDIACNRYRNELDSPHDQEHVTHPERAESGSPQRDSGRGIS